jgi:hypothetical protein
MLKSARDSTVDELPDGRMNTASAARYLGCSPKTLAHMRCYGTGPVFLKAGRVWYFRADLDAWIGSHFRCRSTAQTTQKQEAI